MRLVQDIATALHLVKWHMLIRSNPAAARGSGTDAWARARHSRQPGPEQYRTCRSRVSAQQKLPAAGDHEPCAHCLQAHVDLVACAAQVAEYENCRLLLVDKKISTARDIVGVLEGAIRGGYPLMIMAEDIEQEALATLVVNKLRGSLKARRPAARPLPAPCPLERCHL